MNALNDAKTPELSKSAEGNGEYFVIVCGICRGVDEMQFSKWHNCLKTMQMLHKKEACFTASADKSCRRNQRLLSFYVCVWFLLSTSNKQFFCNTVSESRRYSGIVAQGSLTRTFFKSLRETTVTTCVREHIYLFWGPFLLGGCRFIPTD